MAWSLQWGFAGIAEYISPVFPETGGSQDFFSFSAKNYVMLCLCSSAIILASLISKEVLLPQTGTRETRLEQL
jgi:hypothetical protein